MTSNVEMIEIELKAAKERMREMQMEMDHLISSIPGGVAIYTVDDDLFIPTYVSDGVLALTGYTREEYEEEIRHGVFDHIYEPDRLRVIKNREALSNAAAVVDVSYRICRRDGTLVWVHLNGRFIESSNGSSRFYAVFTGTWADSLLYQSIANETADDIYVIDKQNHEILYANEEKALVAAGRALTGQKCYEALYGQPAPCPFCPLNKFGVDGQEHEFEIDENGRVYSVRFRNMNWNGIPAYIQYLRDVTEEVQTRREKERLEQYFKNIIDTLPGGVSVIRIEPDDTASMEYISSGIPKMTRMTMKETERLYANDICGGVHPDDVEQALSTLTNFLKTGEGPCSITARMRLGDGGYIWVKSSLTMQRSPDGTRRLYSVYTDINKTVEENERVRQQYEDLILQHYRVLGANELILGHCNITQNTLINIMDFSGSGISCDADDAQNRECFFIKLSSYIVDEMERQAFLDVFLRTSALAAFARKETEHIQTCFLRLPGKLAGCYAQIKMNMIEAPGTSDIVGILSIIDITDSVVSEQILRKLSVTTHDYIIDANILTDRFTVLSHNSQAHFIPDLSGCYTARIATMANSVVLEKDKAPYVAALSLDGVRNRLQHEDAYTITYSLRDENGDIRTKNMTVFAIDLRLGRICLVCTDITDSVRALEDALSIARESNRAKSDFLATMSHDIRTPMNAIMGMTTLALAYPDDQERVANCLNKIQVASKHLLSLINDVLDMSRIERSQIAMNLRALSLSALMDELTAIIEPQAIDAGLVFTSQRRNVQKDGFYGDSLRINQILINLLSNAVKFTPKGGRVELLVEGISPLGDENHVRYRFTVRDTGAGISEDFLSRIFDPFARESTQLRIEGTGLGLSIVKGLVDQMNGIISVESRMKQGSVFRVELEFEAAESAKRIYEHHGGKQNSSPIDKPFAGRTFLIAEDHPINAELLYQLLLMDGAQSDIVTDGAQAVEKFGQTTPKTYDAILMDIQMPVMTGYEATRAIRRLDHPDAKTIPIVAMTANAFAEDVHDSMSAGMNAHVAKPIEVDILRSTLIGVLSASDTNNL